MASLLIDTILAIAAHELAHVAMARYLGVQVKRAGISWRGPYIVREMGTPPQNLAITLAGPGINLLLTAWFAVVAPWFALANLLLGVTNLMPLPGSDGKRAWACVRGMKGTSNG